MTESDLIQTLLNNLLESEFHNFPAEGLVAVVESQGVYIISNGENEVLHVGKTKTRQDGLTGRINDHLKNKSSFSNVYLEGNGHKLREGYKYQYLVVDDPRERALLEALATGKLCPLHLGTGSPYLPIVE
jgi:hypothetical protein